MLVCVRCFKQPLRIISPMDAQMSVKVTEITSKWRFWLLFGPKSTSRARRECSPAGASSVLYHPQGRRRSSSYPFEASDASAARVASAYPQGRKVCYIIRRGKGEAAVTPLKRAARAQRESRVLTRRGEKCVTSPAGAYPTFSRNPFRCWHSP